MQQKTKLQGVRSFPRCEGKEPMIQDYEVPGQGEDQFRRMADAAPMMICASGPDGLATYFNRFWLTFTGRRLEQELGYGWMEGLHPDDRQRTLAAYTASTSAHRNCHLEYRLRRADGDYRWIISSGAPWWQRDSSFAGYLTCCTDTTDLRRAREQSFDEQKVAGLRLLAGGIAHDLSNLLSIVHVQAEEMEMEFAEGASPAAALSRLRNVVSCASEVVRELKLYAEEDQATVERIDVSGVIAEMQTLLRVSISKAATLEIDLASDLPAVLGNKTQIRQLVMNLVINASEAITAESGSMRVATSRTAASGAGAGESVRIEVTDTGCGMTDEIRNRLFEGSFTTKAGGRGSGLAMVRGIVRAHGGLVKLTSAPGKGTTFEVLLPSAGQVAGRGFWTSPATAVDAFSVGALTVLLVEKEDPLRSSISRALRRLGFSVLSAPDDEVALDILKNHPMNIDSVILDLTPGRSGLEVLKQVRRIRGRVPVVLTGTGTQVESHNAEAGLIFLPKPYRIERLAKQLRKALTGQQNGKEVRVAAACTGGEKATEPDVVNSEPIVRSAASTPKGQ